MNQKQLLNLLLFAVVLGSAWLLLRHREGSTWVPDRTVAGGKLLGDFPVNDITQIVLRQGSNSVSLVKKEDVWQVNERSGYPADFNRIRDFLLKVKDLKVVQSDTVGASQWTRLGLDAAADGPRAPVSITFENQSGAPVRTLLLGKQHVQKPRGGAADDAEGWPDGRYVRVGSSDAMALISDPLENAESKPDAWLDKSFLRVQRPRSIEVDFPRATNSWRLSRDSESAEWKLANAKPDEKLDSDKVAGVSSPMSSPGFNDVFAGRILSLDGSNKPVVVKIGTFDDFTYTFSIGSKTNDDYPVALEVAAQIENHRLMGKEEKPVDRERLDKEFADHRQKMEDKLKQEQKFAAWTYLVQGWSIDPFLKERAQLLAEKKAEPAPGTAASGSIGNELDKGESPGLPNHAAPSGTSKPAQSNSVQGTAE